MTSQEYTQWLKGFLDAVDNYAITKKQFDSIREKLKEVEDTPIGFPIGNGGYMNPPGSWGGTISVPANYNTPLSGTITTGGSVTTTQLGGSVTATQFPSGTNVSYTDTSGNSSTYTIPTTTNNIFTNQNNEDDEKLLMD
jgi:hypothetical protein